MRTMLRRAGWAMLGAIALAVLALAAKAVEGGPLDPPGPPGSTMRTLADLVPAWDQILTSSGCGSRRWTCVLSNQAVLDNETGLVWEKTPIGQGFNDSWAIAQTECTSDPTGGRYGWRLPSAAELLTLKDSNTADFVSGNPFVNVAGNNFWSATADPADDANARWIGMYVGSNEQVAPKVQNTVASVLCVRGGAEESPQTSDGLQPWSKTLSASTNPDGCITERFTCVLGGAAVLDHETGLVWQRDPGSNASDHWGPAQEVCTKLILGGRRGWRTATVAEMSSLMDVNNTNPTVSLPTGHPFLNYNNTFWSSTPDTVIGGQVYVVGYLGIVPTAPGFISSFLPNGSTTRALCVRGLDSR